MDMILKVQPEIMTAKAGELNTEKTVISGLLDQAKTGISSLTGVWKSEASEEYQSKFNQVYDDITNLLNIVGEYVSDLNEVAAVYTNAEKAAKSAAEGLPTDGVFKV